MSSARAATSWARALRSNAKLIIDMVFSSCSVPPQWRDLNEAQAGGGAQRERPQSSAAAAERSCTTEWEEASSLSLWAAPAKTGVTLLSVG